MGRLAPALTHASLRAGRRRARTLKRVYLPMLPGFVTKISITTPGRSRRSSRRNLRGLEPTATLLLRYGQPPPRQRNLTRDPLGARTPRRRMNVPPRMTLAVSRTIATGLSRGRAPSRTWTL